MNRIRSLGLAVTAIALAGSAQAQTIGFATLQPGTLLNAQASVIAKVVQDHSKLQVSSRGHGLQLPRVDSVPPAFPPA